jgi:cell wall-associated NlpC family hydrolase
MFREPDLLSEQVSQALLGMPVEVIDTRDGWARIETPDTYAGWVESSALSEAPPLWDSPQLEVTDLWANLRRNPEYRRAAETVAFIGTRLPGPGAAVGPGVDGWTCLLLPDGNSVWTESHRVKSVAAEAPHLRPAAILRTARRFLRVPYLWGGCSPMGLDCSGFVQLVYRLHGVPLLRDADMQAGQGAPADGPAAADLVFFGPDESSTRITHVGMMLDRARFIHALGGQCVRIDRLAHPRFAPRYRFARRYL